MINAEEILVEKKQTIVSCSRSTTIKDAVVQMTTGKVGSMLIMEGDEVLGIWTERDLLRNVLQQGFDFERGKIGDHMTTNLHYAKHSDPPHLLLDKFLGLRIRHLLIEKEGKFIGMLSTGDVIKHNLRDTFTELKEQNEQTSWEYYESWGWQPQD
ncbi:MAG: CBS domain-containing protein [Planctomycetes bacterium]|nr:CBS domain-containing protein [Planctomycetota bacterium]